MACGANAAPQLWQCFALLVAQAAFENARIDIFPVPFSIESANASFDKCISGEAPSGPKNQQFKDGVVWADCVGLAANNPVLLVTSDKGFYLNRNYDEGLASNLAVEARATKCGVNIAHELTLVLERVRTEVTIDYENLSSQFLSKTRQRIDDWISRLGFEIGPVVSGEHKLFATDDPAHAYLEFTLSYRCLHPEERQGTLVARGEGTYSPTTGAVRDLQPRGEEFDYHDAAGEQKSISAYVMVGGVSMGHRTVHHDLRVPLETER